MKICDTEPGTQVRLKGGLLLTVKGQDETPGMICGSASGDRYYVPADTEIHLASDPIEEPAEEVLSLGHNLVVVPRRLLLECVKALDEHSGLIQRLEAHDNLNAGDRRAIDCGQEALTALRAFLWKEG